MTAHHTKVPARIELQGMTKIYGAMRANDNVSLSVAPGEIHAVLGENGAGKSTLMKMIYGVTQPDAGKIIWDGQEVQIKSPAQARAPRHRIAGNRERQPGP